MHRVAVGGRGPLAARASARLALRPSLHPLLVGTPLRPRVTVPSRTGPSSRASSTAAANRINNAALLGYVNAYRQWAHLKAKLDPLGLQQRPTPAELSVSRYGLEDGERTFDVEGILAMPNATTATRDQITAHLESVYCGAVGVEAAHLKVEEERQFFADRIEAPAALSQAEKRNVLSLLVQSEFFDRFMTIKFATFKRYGAEGAESMLPAVDAILNQATKDGIENVVLGMPHRGRLNLLVALLDYPARALFSKVKGGTHIPEGLDGWCDVASHIGQSVRKKFDVSKPISVSLIHNPSHLEAVNPVSQGKTRAKMDLSADPKAERHLCLQLHGDAAFAGQGIVPEALQMANLRGFTTGGTVHIIVNNQLGFTTTPERSRSSDYSSDVAKIIGCPILHVNADHPESVVAVARLAMEYRKRFGKDVVVDLIGYRKWGHNEVDEPGFTQPIMYENIRKRKTTAKMYEEKLLTEGVITAETVPKLVAKLSAHLEGELAATPAYKPKLEEYTLQGRWKGITQPKHINDVPATGVSRSLLEQTALASVTLPQDLAVHARIQRAHIDARIAAIKAGRVDWATAEAMAFGSIMSEGRNVRISGQDVERGTFSQRHSIIVDQKSERRFTPLSNAGFKGQFYNVNSHLSEEAVLAFELGYSWESPDTLNIWEAQFGDFHNGAQPIIDTFVTSGETKWLRQSGLVMLLPHGYDGAGPEHSSCRVERFLQLVDSSPAARDSHALNFIVANPSSPANYFHLLRRQIVRSYRKPLIVMGPKTLLRHAAALSDIATMGPDTHFEAVLPDDLPSYADVTTIVLCSGKVYYDLHAKRAAAGRTDQAYIRLEELAPFPYESLERHLRTVITKSKVGVKKLIWFQEEPMNAGAWFYAQERIGQLSSVLGVPAPIYIGRPPLPAPAVGSGVVHKAQEEALWKAIFAK